MSNSSWAVYCQNRRSGKNPNTIFSNIPSRKTTIEVRRRKEWIRTWQYLRGMKSCNLNNQFYHKWKRNHYFNSYSKQRQTQVFQGLEPLLFFHCLLIHGRFPGSFILFNRGVGAAAPMAPPWYAPEFPKFSVSKNNGYTMPNFLLDEGEFKLNMYSINCFTPT